MRELEFVCYLGVGGTFVVTGFGQSTRLPAFSGGVIEGMRVKLFLRSTKTNPFHQNKNTTEFGRHSSLQNKLQPPETSLKTREDVILGRNGCVSQEEGSELLAWSRGHNGQRSDRNGNREPQNQENVLRKCHCY